MKSNPLRQRRFGGGKPFSLINQRSIVNLVIPGFFDGALIVERTILSNGRVDRITAIQAAYELQNNWKPLEPVAPSKALLEILASGASFMSLQARYVAAT